MLRLSPDDPIISITPDDERDMEQSVADEDDSKKMSNLEELKGRRVRCGIFLICTTGRLRLVEVQMGGMQSTLEELLQLQRAAVPASHRSGMRYNVVEGAIVAKSSAADVGLLASGSNFHPTPSESFTTPQTAIPSSPKRDPHLSSAAGSEDEDDSDPLTASANGPWDNMFSLAEAARLKQDGHVLRRPKYPKSVYQDGSGADQPSRKRKKIQPGMSDDEHPEIKRTLPMQRGNQVHAYKDVIDLGICSAEEGRELFNLFMEGCLAYMPCFAPEIDTFESLRARSPFAITTLIMVGAKVMDAAGPVSDLQRQCREHAEKIGMSTLFTPIARLEVVQAMIVLASWGDTSWRPGGHAMRIAMDMALYRCLPLLAQSGMGSGKKGVQLKEDFHLVVGARIWLTLYKMELDALLPPQLDSSISRNEFESALPIEPLISIRYSDDYLLGPSSTLAAFFPFVFIPGAQAWFEYWDGYYEAQGTSKGTFLREFVITGRCGADLYCNSCILRGVRNKRDVAQLSEGLQTKLIIAVKAAEKLVGMCLRSQQVEANLNTHLNIAFAARFLIRVTSLVPEAVNSKQIGRDVENVADMLTQVPGFQFANFLREVITRARRHNVLPPPSRPTSPINDPAPLLPLPQLEDRTASTSTSGKDPSPSSSFPMTSDAYVLGGRDGQSQPFDFSYAEHLFAHPGSFSTPSHSFSFENPVVEQNGFVAQAYNNLDVWFPFPPLEADQTGKLQAGPGDSMRIGAGTVDVASNRAFAAPADRAWW
ncbi:MAG: hypothetical protein TREMPRED_000828 [Tremellales sp. Tagirdzhanova-0007]|nr:MAG: hypothetical protein TREMPRED_000828 [Tremellales sp. Tagirdzhanova-0007]